MEQTNTAVFGMYGNIPEAQTAIDLIVESRTVAGGFTRNDISVLLSDAGSTAEFANAVSANALDSASAGVAAARVVGAAIGSVAGFVVTAIPGLARFIGTGPLTAAITASKPVAASGVGGALNGVGVPEYDANRYATGLGKGGVLLSIHCDTPEEVTRAENLLKDTGAADISCAREKAAPVAAQSY